MIQKIGVRELKNQASGILRQVREESAEFVITYHGKPVATLKPIGNEASVTVPKRDALTTWKKLQELGKQLAASKSGGKSAREHLEEMREEESGIT